VSLTYSRSRGILYTIVVFLVACSMRLVYLQIIAGPTLAAEERGLTLF